MKKKQWVHFNESRAVKVFEAIDNTWLRRGKDGVLNGLVLPQNNWPPQGHGLTDLELSLFLSYAVLSMRGGIISEVPMKLFWQLYEKRPDFFDPKIVSEKVSASEIEKQLMGLLISKREKEEEEKIRRKITARFEDVQISFKFLSKGVNEKTEIDYSDYLQEKLRKIREIVKGYKLDEISRSWFHNMNVLHELWDGDPRNVFKGVKDFEEAFARIDHKKIVWVLQVCVGKYFLC